MKTTYVRHKSNAVSVWAKNKSWKIIGTSMDRLMGLVEVDYCKIHHREYFIKLTDLEEWRHLSNIPLFRMIIEE